MLKKKKKNRFILPKKLYFQTKKFLILAKKNPDFPNKKISYICPKNKTKFAIFTHKTIFSNKNFLHLGKKRLISLQSASF